MTSDVPAGVSGPRWTFAEALIVLVAGFLLSALAASVASAAAGYHKTTAAMQPVVVIVASLLGLWAGLLVGTVYLVKTKASGSLTVDLGLRFAGWKDLVGGVALGLACQYGVIWAMYEPFVAFDPSLRHRLDGPARSTTGAAHGPFEITVVVLFLCLGAPLVEEIFFRGLLLRALVLRFRPWLSVVSTGIVFALVHFEALQLAGLAVFGAILATVAWRTRRLGPGIAAHAAFNAAAVVTSLTAHH